MNASIGFIGAGNMASAIIGGLLSQGQYTKEEIIASVNTDKSLLRLENQFGIVATKDNLSVVNASRLIVLAVKPYVFPEVIEEIKTRVTHSHIIVSIAAGITLNQLKTAFPNTPVYRAMPNTPVSVLEGMTSICTPKGQSNAFDKMVFDVFKSVGKVCAIDESQMHAAIAVHGSSPAYVFLMLEAMGDAGVRLGLNRETAYLMAAQALIGAGKMAIETGLHPGVLKDQVTSPKGTTIEAVAALEAGHFRSTLIEAMTQCAYKSMQMSGDESL